MRKLVIMSLIAFLSSCGLQHTPTFSSADISKIDFSKDLTKSEQKCAYGILFFPPPAGSSYSAIELAKQSKFNRVLAVDYKYESYLLFNRTCTVIYGN